MKETDTSRVPDAVRARARNKHGEVRDAQVEESINAVWHAPLVSPSLASRYCPHASLDPPITYHGPEEDFETPTVPNLRFSPAPA
jgi:hypothetical protein